MTQKEIKSLQVLDHPNIVKYFGTSKDIEHLYIYMEYVSGGSLGSIYR
jgi:mitogen-activated protein kinase kinase kinase